MPILYQNNLQYTNGLQTVVVERGLSVSNVYCFTNLVLSNSSSSSICSFEFSNSKTFIIDNSFSNSERINFSGFYGEIDKLIIPNSISLSSIGLGNTLNKLICLSEQCLTDSTLDGVKSIQLLGLRVGQTLDSISSAYNLEEYIYPNTIGEIDGYLAPNSKLKQVVIPPNCTVPITLLTNMRYLQTLILPQNFNQSLTIYSYQITIPSIIDMLNKVQDNTGGTTQTFNFNDNTLVQMLNTFVVLDNGIWVQATRTTPNAMNLIEAFNSKNWTIS